MKPDYRTMWMFPRNIRRIDPWKLTQIASTLSFSTGDVKSQEIQDALYANLSELGVKRERNADESSNSGGFRTYLAQMACLGLFWKSAKDKQFYPTKAGNAIIRAQQPLQVLRCQLLRMQYPSVYGLGTQVKISPKLNVKPFVFLLDLFSEERLGRRLTCEELAIAVVFGWTWDDYEECVKKILALRSHNGDLSKIITDADLVRTPRRFRMDAPEKDLEQGIIDAVEIANTAKNYLQAALLIEPNEDDSFSLTNDARVISEIQPYLDDREIRPLDPKRQESWQKAYGRYIKATGTIFAKTASNPDGFSVLMRNTFITALEKNPFGVDTGCFLKEQSDKWGKPEATIAQAIQPILNQRTSLQREVLIKASLSGGQESIVLEKGITNLFQQLGFNQSQHIGQLRSKVREGGFPDIYIYGKDFPNCGLGDTKATAKYAFGIGDTNKLKTYYKDCSLEIDKKHPCRFFIYIAGGFARSHDAILRSLNDCTEKFGKPVSAITVNALLDLKELEEQGLLPTKGAELGQELNRIFESINYFVSGSEIENKIRGLT